MTKPHNDFDVAKSINDLLEPLNDERRQRILRWVSESLGIAHAPTSRKPPVPQQAPVPPISKDTQTTNSQQPRSVVDIKTFVDTKAPKSDVQFAAVAAYYYRFEAPEDKRADAITSEILQNATRLAGRSRLTNAGKTLNNAKTLGYLDSSTPGEFQLNTVGENLVAMTLPNGSAPSAKTKKSKKKPPAKKKTKKATKKKNSK